MIFAIITVSALWAAAPLAVYASDLGKWTPAGTTGVTCIHSFLLPGWRLVCTERPHTGYPTNPFSHGLITTEIDLLNGESPHSFKPWQSRYVTRPVDTNAFCAGHSLMANGSILSIGGDEYGTLSDGTTNIYPDGRRGRRIYNPCTTGQPDCVGEWVTLPDMSTRRWYPTVATLADGSQIIIGGSTSNINYDRLKGEENNPTYEYWPPKAGAWPQTLSILSWAFPFMLYPMVFTMPSERVFLFVSNKTVIIDPKTDQLTYTVPDMPALDHLPWIYPYAPTMTVMPMTIKNNFQFTLQICGGSKKSNTDASPMCWRINPDDANPVWTRVDDLPSPRVMVDSIILPDGKVLYVNGAGGGVSGGDAGFVENAYNPVMAPDLYDPEAPAGKQFTTLAPATNYRLYHSGVILVESGHVITTGSEMDNYDDYWKANKTECRPYNVTVYNPTCKQPFNYNLERFAPPYLQAAERLGRPAISTIPLSITHKSTFIIEVSSPVKDIARVTFVRYTTTTHQTNTDQRLIELRILYTLESSIVVQAPDLPGQAPPGNWMLFLLDNSGIPSVARTVNLQLGTPTTVSVPTNAATFVPRRERSDGFSGYTLSFGIHLMIGVFWILPSIFVIALF
ncbi:hypothetical protein BASA83_006471 [Batrachochytrium salamandrivorans]|nr:hypothetical protein BASA62_000502 [Batrachochytrium salamandrivorans]KAH9271379.1 hypothetical protein BASA83_006471 [Batrachochytrium salamandrivorans]